jgi:hypothetical protein
MIFCLLSMSVFELSRLVNPRGFKVPCNSLYGFHVRPGSIVPASKQPFSIVIVASLIVKPFAAPGNKRPVELKPSWRSTGTAPLEFGAIFSYAAVIHLGIGLVEVLSRSFACPRQWGYRFGHPL